MSLNGLAALAPLDWFLSFAGTQNAGRPALMGRITPDAPLLQGKPKPVPPRARPLQPEAPVGHGPFKCRYCGRYGQPGACAGCGAPNQPAPVAMPSFPENRVVRCEYEEPGEGRVEVTVFGDRKRRFVDAFPPAFDMVKR